MARDYKGKRLRSSDEKLLKEGAYVTVPVETLERVKAHITIAFEQTSKDEWNYLRWVLGLIKNELFPKESSTTNKQGQSRA